MTNDVYIGPERRRRNVSLLLVINAVSGVLAAIALVVTIWLLLDLHGRDLAQRAHAAEDSCFLLRGLVFAATPKGQLLRAESYINATALRDCHSYGQKVAGKP